MGTAAPAAVRPRPHAARPTLGHHADGRRFAWKRYLSLLNAGDYDPDCLFELDRGVFRVVHTPNPWHFYVLHRLRAILFAWDAAHPGQIELIGGGGESRFVIPISESDRHPDLAVYTSLPPSGDSHAWWDWPPALAVEVVSGGSGDRDHEIQPPEYLAYGVGEYWVLDPDHPDRPGPSARVFTRNESGDAWDDRWEDEAVTSDRFPGLRVPVADVLAPLPEPDAESADDVVVPGDA